jgi:hypothetical protein
MKLWINFEEKDIKKRKNGWKEGSDWESQLEFEEEQDLENCFFDFDRDKVTLHFNNGIIEMTKKEFGELFK